MRKEINAKIATFIFLLVVSALLVFLNELGYFNQPKNFTIFIASPVAKTFQNFSNKTNDFFYTLESIDKFKKENIDLKKENLKLACEVSKLREIERENGILKRQLDFSDNICLEGTCLKWKEGRIISRDPSNYGKYIIIDLGKKQGAAEGGAVVVSGGVLIGKISETLDDFSKVMLITSSESSTNSITQATRANGVVKGRYATGAKLEMINQNEQLINGDLVITSGLEDMIPKGLLIGKISNVEESANGVFKQADVSLFADLDHLEEVFIIDQND